MNAIVSGYSQADLRFFLPLMPGQRVGVLSESKPLVATLTADGLDVALIAPPATNDSGSRVVGILRDRSDDFSRSAKRATAPALAGGAREVATTKPFREAPIVDLDHLIIPEYSSDCYDFYLSRILQRLKPGGWLLLGIHNFEALYHFLSKKRPVGQSHISLRKSSALLYRNGLGVVRCFGAYDELEHPEILVPLDTGEAAYFFFRNIFVPPTRFAAWTRPAAALLASIGLQRLLFRGLVIIAQRPSGGNDDH